MAPSFRCCSRTTACTPWSGLDPNPNPSPNPHQDGTELSLLLTHNGLHVELVVRPGDAYPYPYPYPYP